MMSKAPATGRGYAALFAQRVLGAAGTSVGVQLGKLCVEHNIPVAWVAGQTGASRQTVYKWFLGEGSPQADRLVKVEKLLARLRKRLS